MAGACLGLVFGGFGFFAKIMVCWVGLGKLESCLKLGPAFVHVSLVVLGLMVPGVVSHGVLLLSLCFLALIFW